MKIMNPEYLRAKYPTPEVFTNKYPGSNVLIIGTGPSTQKLLKYKDQLKKKFDAIIGVNFTIKNFEAEMDFHVISEKFQEKLFIYPDNSNVFRTDLHRVFNWKTIPKYPSTMNFVKFNRNHFDGRVDIRKYKTSESEGLFIGPIGQADGLSVGTVVLQSMHLASILGCANIYLSGVDLIFAETLDHYYNDRFYRDKTKHQLGTPIVNVVHNGKECQTLRLFKDSADYINHSISHFFKPAGVNVFSFSDGLVTGAQFIDVDSFFGDK